MLCILLYPLTGTQLNKVIKQARSGDSGKVKTQILDHLPTIEDVPKVDHNLAKQDRGFKQLATARLLCPASLRHEFDKEPEL